MHDDAMPGLPENLARWDRTARVLLGVVLFAVGTTGIFAEPISTALRLGALIPLLTGAFGWCPLYSLLHLDTRRNRG